MYNEVYIHVVVLLNQLPVQQWQSNLKYYTHAFPPSWVPYIKISYYQLPIQYFININKNTNFKPELIKISLYF